MTTQAQLNLQFIQSRLCALGVPLPGELGEVVSVAELRWPDKYGNDDHGRGPDTSKEENDEDEVAIEDVFAKMGEPPPDDTVKILETVKPTAQFVKGQDLVPTQDTLSRETLDKYSKQPSKALPDVISKDGKMLLVDGHHRVGAGLEKGQEYFHVNVYKAP